MLALAFLLLATASASNFLETPTNPSIEASGMSKRPIPSVTADENIESDAHSDDVQSLGGSDVDDQDVDLDDAEMSEDSSPTEDAEAADAPTELEEMPLANDGSSLLEHGEPLETADAEEDDDPDMAAAGEDTTEFMKAAGDEEDAPTVDNLDSPEESVDDASSTAEDLPDSDDIMQEVENLDMSKVLKAVSDHSEEKPEIEPAAKLPQTRKVSIKATNRKEKAVFEPAAKLPQTHEVSIKVPELTKVQPKGKPQLSDDAEKVFQPIRMQVSDLQDKVFASPKFKAKVISMCKKHSEVPNCDQTMKEFVFCKLLRDFEPKAADHLCAGVSMNLADISGKKIASLSSTGSSLQVGIAEEVAEKMVHDLEMNFDTIVSL